MKSSPANCKTRNFFTTLFGRIFSSSVGAIIMILMITLGITMYYTLDTIQINMDQKLISTAKETAINPLVIKVLEQQAVDSKLNDYLDYIIQINDDISLITVADTDSKRYYHLQKDLIGKTFVGGDEGLALSGETYISEAVGTQGFQRRGFTPVYGNDEKTIIGFVMASMMKDQMREMQHTIIATYLKIGAAVILLTAILSFFVTKNIKKEMLGLEPEQLSHAFIAREDVLDTLGEGILSINASGRIDYANRAAKTMLHTDGERLIGQAVKNVLALRHEEIAGQDRILRNKLLSTESGTILLDKIPRAGTKKADGSVIILRDRTEVTHMAEQLTGSKHIISALRANTHEFMNKLHVILGFLQMNAITAAVEYIEGISREQSEHIRPILKRIQNPTIAALLIGKTSSMNEQNIEFSLIPDSYLPEHSTFLTSKNLVAIIGNLLENSIESVLEKKDPSSLRRIELQIREDEKGLQITVDDTGIGMTAEVRNHMFTRNFSTKGELRGTGLALVKDIIDSFGGAVETASVPGEGTSVTLYFNKHRPEKTQPSEESERL